MKGVGSANGPCVVTDQGVFTEWQATYKLYPNDQLFQGMGSEKSYMAWGSAQKGLFDDRAWTSDLLRKICIQLWQPAHSVDHRVVDIAGGEKNWGAPFFCSRDLVYPAIFGSTRPVKGTSEGTEGSITFHMEDLRSDRAARAIDACRDQHAAAFVVNSTSKAQAARPTAKTRGGSHNFFGSVKTRLLQTNKQSSQNELEQSSQENLVTNVDSSRRHKNSHGQRIKHLKLTGATGKERSQ